MNLQMNPSRLLALCCAALLGALAAYPPLAGAAATEGTPLPNIGQSGAGAISPADERQLGRQIVREIVRAGGMLDDPLLDDYLRVVGTRLSSRSDAPDLGFEFFAVRDQTLNAFALPGGFIGVNVGLLLATKNEAELAGVMAHEIAHVTQRHVARRVEAGRQFGLESLAVLLGAILVGMSGGGGDAIQGTLMGGSALVQQQQVNFTRSNEYEADRVGIGTLAAAGYDPEGMISFFEEMGRQNRWIEGRLPEFLSTHPLSAQRITEARSRARREDVELRAPDRMYALMHARARALTAPEPQAALAHFERSRPEADDSRYGRALALLRLGRHAEAVAAVRSLLAEDASVIPYHLLLAEAQAAGGERAAALATYRDALRITPGNSPLTIGYAEALLADGQWAAAHEAVLDLITRVRPEPRHYRLLAQAAEAGGSPADAHYWNSEWFVLNGDLFGALDQLKLALKQPGLSDFQRSRLQARLERLSEFIPLVRAARGQQSR